ncbi:hypothetical protein M8994_17380 [Brucella sp. 21LCYQ03]|nr:hypothetical protein [Brucella sp. 21LCYQ03]
MDNVYIEIRLTDTFSGQLKTHGKHFSPELTVAVAAENLALELSNEIPGTPWSDFQTVQVVLRRGANAVQWRSEPNATVTDFVSGMKRCGARLDEWILQWRERWRVRREKHAALKHVSEAKQ